MINLKLKNENRKDLLAYILLIAFAATIIAFVHKQGFLYGSQIDWINQHSVIPEYFRQKFYATGNLFPDFAMNLGAGQNIYTLSYYGMFNPIILISYLLPGVKMMDYIVASSIVVVIISVCLCYYWLRNKKFSNKISFIVAFLFLCSGPLIFHSHKQIMFMDYYPFLFLALLGVDRFNKAKKLDLFILGIFLCIMTSYFFSVGCIVTVFLYALYEYMNNNEDASIKGALLNIRPYFIGVMVATLMSAILWLPTLYTILNGRVASTDSKISILSLLIPDIKGKALLYSAYSLGLTSVSLIILIANVISRRIKDRIFSIILIILFVFPIILYILNGTLYVEAKAIIPLIPIYLIVIAVGLTRFENYVVNNVRIKSNWKTPALFIIFFLMMTEATISCFVVNHKDKMVPIKEFNEIYNTDKISLIQKILKKDHSFYRMNDLTNVGNTQNLVYDLRYNQTSMYTSTYNGDYFKFYQNIFNNPASTVVRLVCNSAYNIYFQNFMNVKYVVAKGNPIAGYAKIDQKGDYILYKNENTMPIGYATNKTMSLNDFGKLNFPDYMGIFFNRIIVDKTINNTGDLGNSVDTKVKKIDLKMTNDNMKNQKNIVISSTGSDLSIDAEENASFDMPLDFNLNDNILILSFHISNKEYVYNQASGISINGVLNEIPDTSFRYPKNDKDFVYFISSNDKINKLHLEVLKGNYEISDVKAYIAPTTQINEGISGMDPFIVDTKRTGDNIIIGDIKVGNTGYFATTIPYDKGFEITVDGKKQNFEKVNTAFLGFPINKGEHHIVIKYEAPFKIVGLAVSGIGFIIFAGFCLIKKKKINVETSKETKDLDVN